VTAATLLFRVAVTGDSMRPTLHEGDWLLVRRLGRRPRVGELVVVPDPREPRRLLVKRIAAVDGDAVTIVGDRPDASTDSREFGPVELATILGHPFFRYAPLDRVGVVH